MKTILVPTLLCIAAAASAQAPEAGAIREGTRVKIRTATIHAAVGSVARSTADSVVLIDDKGARLGIARSEITQLYVSNGRTPRAGATKAVPWGLGFGVIGGAMALTDPCANSPDKNRCKEIYGGQSRGGLVAGMFASGFLGGVLAGAMIKAEEWRETPTQSRFALKPNGLGVALSVNFR
jgi:hypothetical protein